VTLTFDLLTLKVVSESRVTWAIPVPILVFLGLSVLDVGPTYATDRRQTKASLNARLLGAGHNKNKYACQHYAVDRRQELCSVISHAVAVHASCPYKHIL